MHSSHFERPIQSPVNSLSAVSLTSDTFTDLNEEFCLAIVVCSYWGGFDVACDFFEEPVCISSLRRVERSVYEAFGLEWGRHVCVCHEERKFGSDRMDGQETVCAEGAVVRNLVEAARCLSTP